MKFKQAVCCLFAIFIVSSFFMTIIMADELPPPPSLTINETVYKGKSPLSGRGQSGLAGFYQINENSPQLLIKEDNPGTCLAESLVVDPTNTKASSFIQAQVQLAKKTSVENGSNFIVSIQPKYTPKEGEHFIPFDKFLLGHKRNPKTVMSEEWTNQGKIIDKIGRLDENVKKQLAHAIYISQLNGDESLHTGQFVCSVKQNGVHLMSASAPGNEKISNENNLYLYQNPRGEIYYKSSETLNEFIHNTVKPMIKKQAFRFQGERCTNEDILKVLAYSCRVPPTTDEITEIQRIDFGALGRYAMAREDFNIKSTSSLYSKSGQFGKDYVSYLMKDSTIEQEVHRLWINTKPEEVVHLVSERFNQQFNNMAQDPQLQRESLIQFNQILEKKHKNRTNAKNLGFNELIGQVKENLITSTEKRCDRMIYSAKIYQVKKHLSDLFNNSEYQEIPQPIKNFIKKEIENVIKVQESTTVANYKEKLEAIDRKLENLSQQLRIDRSILPKPKNPIAKFFQNIKEKLFPNLFIDNSSSAEAVFLKFKDKMQKLLAADSNKLSKNPSPKLQGRSFKNN